jgi:hypothetical protein
MTDLYHYLISKIIVRYAKNVPRKKMKILGETVVVQHKKNVIGLQSLIKKVFFLQTIWNFPNLDLTRFRWYELGKTEVVFSTIGHELFSLKVLSFAEIISRWQRGEWRWIISDNYRTGRRGRRKTCPNATVRTTNPTRTTVTLNPCLRSE